MVFLVVGNNKIGGVQILMKDLFLNLCNLGVECKLVYLTGKNEGQELENIIHLDSTRIKHSITKLRTLLRSSKVSHIISGQPHVTLSIALASARLGIKKIYVEHNPFFYHNTRIDYIYQFCKLFYYRNSHALVAINPRLKNQLILYKKITNSKAKILLIPNSLRSELISEVVEDNSLEKKMSFLAVSRIENQKNLRLMIESFAAICKHYPDAFLSIAGTGSLLKTYQELVRTKYSDLNITFYGEIEDVASLYNKHKFFLNSSIFEGFGISIVESMLFRCIPICTPTDGARFILGANGFLSEDFSLASYVLEIFRAINMDTEGIEKLSLKLQTRAKELSDPKNMARRYADVLD